MSGNRAGPPKGRGEKQYALRRTHSFIEPRVQAHRSFAELQLKRMFDGLDLPLHLGDASSHFVAEAYVRAGEDYPRFFIGRARGRSQLAISSAFDFPVLRDDGVHMGVWLRTMPGYAVPHGHPFNLGLTDGDQASLVYTVARFGVPDCSVRYVKSDGFCWPAVSFSSFKRAIGARLGA